MRFLRKIYRKKTLSFVPPFLFCSEKWLLLFFVFNGVSLFTSAQTPADNQCVGNGILPGVIKVLNPVGCAPHQIIDTQSPTGLTNIRYIFDYKGGAPSGYTSTTDASFNYTKAGSYVVMKLSENAQGQPQRACTTIVVQDPTPPEFTVVPCPDGNVTLTITNHDIPQYEEYVIEWGDGNASIINRLNLSAPHHYTNFEAKSITVQGKHKTSNCGGKATRTVSLNVATVAPKITKLEILDATTGELTLSNPNQFELTLYRQNGLTSFQNTGAVVRSEEEKVKITVDTNRIFCYKFRPTENCIASLESNILCTTFLKVVPSYTYNSINIAPYLYPAEITKRTVTKNNAFWWAPTQTVWSKDDPEAQCGKQACYRLQLSTKDGEILSNEVCVNPPAALCASLAGVFVPDAFTPNGDGINDVFEIKTEAEGESEIFIYDRWGNIIFKTTPNVRYWNGKINGQLAPNGPYFYKVVVNDKVGRSFIKRGTVALLR